MRWRKESDHLAISDAGYKVARFIVELEKVYRASFRGQFIGPVKDDPKGAQQLCENHWQVTGQFEKQAMPAKGEDDEE